MKTKMKQKISIQILLFGLFAFFFSCNKTPKEEAPLVVPIYCDDDFKPFISSGIDVFESMQNDQTPRGLIPIYGNEKEAFDLLVKDSVRIIVASRKISDYEKKVLLDTQKLIPRNVLIGYDGLAIIVNNNNPDSLITVENLRNIFTGKINKWEEVNPASKLGDIQPVFNNPASGTVRYAQDSICKGAELSANLKALKTNEEVLQYVSETPNAMGIIGVSWISNERDSLQLSFSEKVNVMKISKEETATKYNSYSPFQYYIKTGDYPFYREVYIVHTDPAYGTERKFADFMARDRGQLIIKNAGLLPVSPTTTQKQIKVKDN